MDRPPGDHQSDTMSAACQTAWRSALFLALVMTLASVNQSRADIGVVVEEPIGALGFFTRVGHMGTYLSNICPDGSPVRMRLCRPGEHGGVVSKYSPFSEHEDFDWAITPFEEYLHGFAEPDRAPLFGTPSLQAAIERNFFPLLAGALHTTDGVPPAGQWRDALATRFDRSLYLFAVETSRDDDLAIVAAFNAAPNKSRFNFFYRNCSDQARDILALVWPGQRIGNLTSGLTMQTPKGLAQWLVRRAQSHPDLHLHVTRYPQLPGTYARSRPILYPLENTYRSLAFAPWWFFGGFREVALGAMFYHQVIAPFSVTEAASDFMTPEIAARTREQRLLRSRQDEIRKAQATIEPGDPRWLSLATRQTAVYRRLIDIRREKRTATQRQRGTPHLWRELQQEFEAIVVAVDWRRFAPSEVLPQLTRRRLSGAAAKPLLHYFDNHGEFFIDENGGPWMRLRLGRGELCASGLSASQVANGDPRVAALVLTAVLDFTMHATPERRENVDVVEALLARFREVTRDLPHLNAGVGDLTLRD